MKNGPISAVLRQLSRLATDTAPDSDGELLARFVSRRDDEAFAVLMRRHGPMVLGVCRRVLGHTQDAEDSFQATFLLLAQRAGSIRKRDSLSSWLHGVAFRLSARARARRHSHLTPAYSAPQNNLVEPGAAAAWRELQALLDEEVQRLPDVCRSALVLCYFEGTSHEEAAARLGWPVGSVKSRLNRARQLLRDRLARRGVGLSVGALGAFLAADGAAAPLPTTLLGATLTAARHLLEEGVLHGFVSGSVIDVLKDGAAALPSRGGSTLAAMAAMVVLIGGGSFVAWQFASEKAPAVAQDIPPPQVQAADQMPRTDRYGDALPDGALVRFGSVRLRHGVNLRSVVFSPTEDVIVSGGAGPWLIYWDPATGKELRHHKTTAKYHTKVVFGHDGAVLAVDEGSDVVLRDTNSGKELRRLSGHKGPIGSISWSARGDRIASTARDQTIRLWDAATGKELLRIEDAHGQEAHNVALPPDGTFVVSASYDKDAKLWDAATGKERRRFTIREGAFQTLALSHEGTVLATSDERSARLWDVATGKELRKLEGEPGRGHFAFAPGDKTLAHGGHDGFVRVFETATGRKLHEFRAHPENINALSFSRDGKSLATGYADSTIHVWDAVTGKQTVVLDGHQERLVTAAWSPDGRRVATGGWDRTVRVWDSATGKESLRLEGQFDQVERLAFSADGARLLASVLEDKRSPRPIYKRSMLIWDASTGKLLREIEGSEPALTRDGRLVAAVTHTREGSVVVVREVATAKELHRLSGLKSQVRRLEFSRDGKTLAAVVQNVLLGFRVAGEEDRQDENAIHLWDVESGRKLRALGGKQLAGAFALTPDGRTLATSEFRGGAVYLWEARTGQQRGQLSGHEEMVFGAAFAPDGRTVATAGMDGTLRLWELPSGKELRRFEGHRGWMLGVAWSPDGKKVVTTSTDTTALVWNVSGLGKQAPRPNAQELDAAWTALAGDGRDAFVAIGTYLAAPDAAVAYLRERLKPVSPLKPSFLAQRIAELKDERFTVRDAASKELERIGESTEAALRKALDTEKELEPRRRIEAVLERIRLQKLRDLRAIEALEYVGTDEARAVLRTLAAGTTAAATEAAASLARIAR